MTVKSKPPRPYHSTLRDAQSAQTRERILMAAKEFLETEDFEKLTLRRVAELADVSAPTVYAHFPTMDDLSRAFFFWLKPHLGTDQALPALAEFPTVAGEMFPRFARQGRLLRNLMNTPAWDRLRRDDWKTKQDGWASPIKDALPALTDKQIDRAAIALSAFSTPNMWRWLIDIAGCSPAEAEQIAGWAIGAMVAALERNPAGLADTGPETPRKTSLKRKGTSS